VKTDTEIRIRSATADDLPFMISLAHESSAAAQWSKSTYQQLLQSENPRITLVAEEGDVLCGFVVAQVTGTDCELENIVVNESSQRRGFGLKLMQALITAVRKRGAQRIFLEVRESNTAACGLYAKSGFVVVGNRRSYYHDPTENAVLYALQLRELP